MSSYNPHDICFLTWHIQSRSRNLAACLNAELLEFEVKGPTLWRHSISSIWTVYKLIRKTPAVVFLQYSFLLLTIVALYKIGSRHRIIVVADCHTKALRRRIKGLLSNLFLRIKRWSFTHVDALVISNKGLCDEASSLNSAVSIIPDPIPLFDATKDAHNRGKYCVFICSFAADEPLEELLQAAELLQNEIKIYWTGRTPKSLNPAFKNSKNIVFTSYLTDSDYMELVANAACCVILTTEENCLVSGGYECLGTGTPMVLSDTDALREFFSSAAVYTSHDPQSIAISIRKAIDLRNQLKMEAKRIRQLKRSEFGLLLHELMKQIQNAQMRQL